jgi:N-acetylglucosamine-6-phosphate deacetylase
VPRLARLGVGHGVALAAAVSRPAQLLGVADRVSLAPGSSANFFVLNDEFELTQRVTPDEILDLQ